MTANYEHWYREAEKGMGSSEATVMIFSGKQDEKLSAEISVAVKLQIPVYLLLKEGERPPPALEAADLIRDFETFQDNEDFNGAAQRLVGRMSERLRSTRKGEQDGGHC